MKSSQPSLLPWRANRRFMNKWFYAMKTSNLVQSTGRFIGKFKAIGVFGALTPAKGGGEDAWRAIRVVGDRIVFKEVENPGGNCFAVCEKV